MLGAEILETCAIEDVAMLEASISCSLRQTTGVKSVSSTIPKSAGHCLFIEVFPCPVADKQQLGFGMIDDVVDIVGLELMQNGNNDSS